MRQTSIQSFKQIQHSLGTLQQIVFRAIINHPYCTDRELTEFLGVTDPNVVRPRRKELLDQNLIIDMGVRECTITHKQAHMWAVNLEVIA